MADSLRALETLELVGGVLCLDFVNTLNSRRKPEHDYVTQYADLASWAGKVGFLSAAQNLHLQKRAKQEAEKAENTLQKARTFRELLYRLFSNLARQSEPNPEDLASFVPFYGEAIQQSRLVKKNDYYTADWELDQTYEVVLWPIIYSAGRLLLSKELRQVKECPGCGWLFLDTSKNQSRRWCSMNTCGARDKMRRYHSKVRAK